MHGPPLPAEQESVHSALYQSMTFYQRPGSGEISLSSYLGNKNDRAAKIKRPPIKEPYHRAIECIAHVVQPLLIASAPAVTTSRLTPVIYHAAFCRYPVPNWVGEPMRREAAPTRKPWPSCLDSTFCQFSPARADHHLAGYPRRRLLLLCSERRPVSKHALKPLDLWHPRLVITNDFRAQPTLGMPILHQHLCPKLSRHLGQAWKALSPCYAESCHLFSAESRTSAPWKSSWVHTSLLRVYSEFDAYDPAMHTAQRPLQATCSSRIEITGSEPQ